MTLKEYIEKARTEYSLAEDAESIAERIRNTAREQAKNGCAVLSDEEVLEIIMDPEKGKAGKITDPPKEDVKRPSRVVKIEPEKEKAGTVKYGDGDMESLF